MKKSFTHFHVVSKAKLHVMTSLLAIAMLFTFGNTDYASAASLTTSYKSDTQNNPIVTQRFSADPSVMVYNDTVYVYTTNDIIEYNNGNIIENSYGKITTLNCFSSKDLVNWTDHGTIQVAGSNGAAKWAYNSWAPCATYKTINGKVKFFLYFANSAGGIGVLTSDSPTGPWSDPIGRALITKSTANCYGVEWLFDPAVFVDSDGTGYLYFGGGIPGTNYASPKTARVVKLGNDMISLAGTPVTIDAPYLFEDSGINKIGNKYYYSYCSNWNTSGSRYSSAAIEYMVSNSPLGPFTYAGELFKNPGNYFGVWGNNHHSIFEFKGQYYMAYHARALETAMLKKNYGYRSTQIDKLTFSNGAFTELKPTMTGPAQITYLNPYQTVQAETMAIQAGVSVTGSGDTKVTDIQSGDWTCVKGVQFDKGTSSIQVSVSSKTSGSIKVYTGSRNGTLIGTISVPNTSGQYKTVTANVSNVTGVKDIYFVFQSEMSFDTWKFTGKDGSSSPETGNNNNTGNTSQTGNNGNTDNTGSTGNTGNAGNTSNTETQNTLIRDGWYYIQNTNAQKYLQVSNNQAGNAVNVELGSRSGAESQKWYVKNLGNGYITLKNGLGYMLDVVYGRNENGTNIQTYQANGMDAQTFQIKETGTNQVYGILTKASSGTKALDAYNWGTTDGTNICQWTYYGQKNQMFLFEACDTNTSGSTANASGNSNQTNHTTSGNTTNQTTNTATKTQYNWKFSNQGFANLGTLSKTVSVNDLTIAATEKKTVAVKSDTKTYGGTTYTKYLALGGAGKATYRSISFIVNGPCTITITGKSSGSTTRYLGIYDSNGNCYEELEFGSSLSKKSYQYTGSKQILYLCSTNSGINLYEVDIK